MRFRRLAVPLLFLELIVAAYAPSARSQAPATLSITPAFPAAVEVGRAGVAASLELANNSLIPSLVTAVTVDVPPGGSIVLSSVAQGIGPACEGVSFDVSGPDAAGRHVFSSASVVVLTAVIAPTCTIRFTVGARTGVVGGQVAPVATLTVLPLVPFLAGTATGQSVMRVVPAVPLVTTTASAPTATQGTPVGSDVAVAAGSVGPGTPGPTGAVTFRLFGPDDAQCARPPVFTSGPVALVAGRASSPTFTPRASGAYRWTAVYAGDLNYEARGSDCNTTAASVMVERVVAPVPTTTPTSSSSPAALSTPTSTSPTSTSPTSTSTAPTPSTLPNGAAGSPLPTLGTAPLPPPGAATLGPGPGPTAGASPGDGPAPYDPAAHASEVVDHEVGAFVLLGVVLGAAGGRAVARAGSGSDGKADVVSTQVNVSEPGAVLVAAHVLARGDRSRTWRWPATAAVDRWSVTAPQRVARLSPLLARVVDDPAYLRAILGAAAAVVPLAAIAMGVLAVSNVHGQAQPPAFGLLMAVAVLGVLDATAGLLAVVVFVAGVILLGGLSSADAARTLLAVALLWFTAPLIAGAARPLLRNPTSTMAEHWERLADVVIASLIGAWAVQQFLQALPILSGLDLPIAQRADDAALIVLAALAGRMAIETLAAHWYPIRLSRVQNQARPGSWAGQRLTAKVLTLGVFLFVAASYVGLCWQLYVGAALFVVPQLLELFEHRLPNVPGLHSLLPKGIVQIVLLLLVTGYLGVVAVHRFHDGQELVRWSFLLLAVPSFVFAMLDRFGREGPAKRLLWRHQILGVLVLAIGVLSVVGVIGF